MDPKKQGQEEKKEWKDKRITEERAREIVERGWRELDEMAKHAEEENRRNRNSSGKSD